MPPSNTVGQSNSEAAEPVSDTASDIARQKQEIWDSDDMKAARKAVLQFCRHSAQSSVAEGEQFLAELSKLTPEDMLSWLDRFQTRQERFRHESEASQLSRQFSVEQSYLREEERQQSAQRIAELRGLANVSRTPQPLVTVQGAGYSSPLSLYYGPSYDPFIPIFDPSSPRGYVARAAAAASLPGDLPRSDPRNFLRGDEGFVTGDEPTTPVVASPIPVLSPVLSPAPIAAAPAFAGPAPTSASPAFVGPVLESAGH